MGEEEELLPLPVDADYEWKRVPRGSAGVRFDAQGDGLYELVVLVRFLLSSPPPCGGMLIVIC